MRIYETVPEEVDEVLRFRNAIFNELSRAQWEAMDCTAVVAREDNELVGFIPLQFRRQRLNARVAIPVVYENAVGVAEGKRGQGIGTQMLDEAARFIGDRADAMMVIRGGEDSIGYRFYRKTGHGDLMYARNYAAPVSVFAEAGCEGVAEATLQEWLALEPRLVELYERQYHRFGGGRPREAGYWRAILAGHVYRERTWRLAVLGSPADPASIRGYVVAVPRGTWRPTGVNLFEVIGEDDEAVRRMVCWTTTLKPEGEAAAGEGQRQVIVPAVSLANPIQAVLDRIGFVAQSTTPHILARILRPDRIWATLAAGSGLRDTLALTVCTPHRTLEVSDPPGARYRVILETKENLASRLFCCRLDLNAALDMEMVRLTGDPAIVDELAHVFEFCDWVQWFTDYV